MSEASLAALIEPCGPIVEPAAAARARARLSAIAAESGWSEVLDAAWDALAPAFSSSPYLTSLAVRRPERLPALLAASPQVALARILASAADCAEHSPVQDAGRALRVLKGDLHLLAALSDLGGLWSLDEVTGALSQFADLAVRAALRVAAEEVRASGRLERLGVGAEGPVPGLFIVAMGKQGAFELNYSSDIDVTVFFDPEALPSGGTDPAVAAGKIVEHLAELLQTRTADGYVFRVDLRLRPDPSSARSAVSVPAAYAYYESVGQNWERAALIKARVAAGDLPRGEEFLAGLAPFIWRRNLDFAAIADIHSIKRQIHAYKVDERLSAAGADLKLGRGGIREIEFFVQTQQLILGGRRPDLRSPRTLDALAALAADGHVANQDAEELASSYIRLRSWEHRIQMVADEQSHRLPEADSDRRRIAALAGFTHLRAFDGAVRGTLRTVNRRYAALFAGEEPLSSRFGSLIFTGVEDDPETLRTLKRMNFTEPGAVSGAIRNWHHGSIGPTRTERGRELFTRLAPRLLEAAAATGAPDVAFRRFADFFSRQTSGVQLQSLFLAQPALLALIVRIMAFAPRFAATLARRPTALDALLDPDFFAPIAPPSELPRRIAETGSFEDAMNLARRERHECAFRIAVQVLEGASGAGEAGAAFSDLAEAVVAGLAQAALKEVEQAFGAFDGDVAVVALGKFGSREMSAQSDLDLMTFYRPRSPDAAAPLTGMDAGEFYARFTQRLVAALSVPTTEGGLYEVDMRLRPSGTKGPVAVSLAAFERYYAAEAETWEYLALTRARAVWASSPGFDAAVADALETALRRPRDRGVTARDVAAMRGLVATERPTTGFWDMKLSGGGLVDVEFAVQFLQIVNAPARGPLRPNIGEALAALSGAAPGPDFAALEDAWRLQQALAQLLKIALEDGDDPEREPKALRALLARAGDVRDFSALKRRLKAVRQAALEASNAVLAQ